jgi:adenosine deaminase
VASSALFPPRFPRHAWFSRRALAGTMNGVASTPASGPAGAVRDLVALPKAHLHLHLVGGMRPETLREFAMADGLPLPSALTRRLGGAGGPLRVTHDGWFRFQRLYDAARAVLTSPARLRRVIGEIARDERADGACWVELQVDPSGYVGVLGGLVPVVEMLTDAVRDAGRAAGIGMVLVLAANRTRHPGDAATIARLAVRYREAGVVGFGLSNDERRGPPQVFGQAFRIARRGDLLLVPHGGETNGADSVRHCVELGAHRIGHGVRAVEDPDLLDLLARRGIACEVCPTSNVALGIAPSVEQVPLRKLLDAGVPVALGADDPLLFGARLVAQYRLARTALGFDDAALAQVARYSLLTSAAPETLKQRGLAGVDRWLHGD